MSTTPLSPIDRKILAALAQDARVPMGTLAARVGVSRRHCRARLNQLEQDGVIQGYRAVLDPRATGQVVEAFVQFSLTLQDAPAQARFEQVLLESPEVLECHLVTGTLNYLVRLRTDHIEQLTSFLTEQLASCAGSAQLRTSLVVRTLKRAG